jgi:very-short-patch-repair endonuclease
MNESIYELELQEQMREYEFPVAERHYKPFDDSRHSVDFAFPDVKVAIEISGFKSQHIWKELKRNAEKDDKLKSKKWKVLRFDGYQVQSGDALLMIYEVLRKKKLIDERKAGIRQFKRDWLEQAA